MSTVFGSDDLLGLLPEDNPVLIPASLTTTSGTATIALVPAAAREEVLAVMGWGG